MEPTPEILPSPEKTGNLLVELLPEEAKASLREPLTKEKRQDLLKKVEWYYLRNRRLTDPKGRTLYSLWQEVDPDDLLLSKTRKEQEDYIIGLLRVTPHIPKSVLRELNTVGLADFNGHSFSEEWGLSLMNGIYLDGLLRRVEEIETEASEVVFQGDKELLEAYKGLPIFKKMRIAEEFTPSQIREKMAGVKAEKGLEQTSMWQREAFFLSVGSGYDYDPESQKITELVDMWKTIPKLPRFEKVKRPAKATDLVKQCLVYAHPGVVLDPLGLEGPAFAGEMGLEKEQAEVELFYPPLGQCFPHLVDRRGELFEGTKERLWAGVERTTEFEESVDEMVIDGRALLLGVIPIIERTEGKERVAAYVFSLVRGRKEKPGTVEVLKRWRIGEKRFRREGEMPLTAASTLAVNEVLERKIVGKEGEAVPVVIYPFPGVSLEKSLGVIRRAKRLFEKLSKPSSKKGGVRLDE